MGGLLFVERTSKLCVCKHCKHVIGPTFFDAHREVCALRMRQSGATAATRDEAESESRLCVKCKTRDREHALLPCGHLLHCAQCAADVRVCPHCCRQVEKTLPTYGAYCHGRSCPTRVFHARHCLIALLST